MAKGFGSDNHSGVHPEILKAICQTNDGHHPSYGTDPITAKAIEVFKQHFGSDIEVHFVFNGTAANVLSMAPLVKSYHSIFCSDTSHLNTDECGAPEAWIGAKLIPLPSTHGKINPEDIHQHMIRLGDQHFSQPALISITQPTELGTVYTIEELKKIIAVAKKYRLYIHMDGARLSNAVMHLACSFKELTADLGIDVLSFGGTKNGLLGAEAVVFFSQARNADFRFIRKQSMQLPSKMRFLSAQFIRYFENNLWREIAAHSSAMAQRLTKGIAHIPEIKIIAPTESNAVFVKIPRTWVKPLRDKFFFYVWDEHEWVMRWMTTFDTTPEDIDQFIALIENVRKENS